MNTDDLFATLVTFLKQEYPGLKITAVETHSYESLRTHSVRIEWREKEEEHEEASEAV